MASSSLELTDKKIFEAAVAAKKRKWPNESGFEAAVSSKKKQQPTLEVTDNPIFGASLVPKNKGKVEIIDIMILDQRTGYFQCFKTMEEIGRGGFGVVKRGRNFATGEEVAIKTISVQSHTELSSLPDAQYLLHYPHRNIVELKHYGYDIKDQHVVHIVMELAQYNLRALLGHLKTLNENTTRRIMQQILQGIDSLHRHNIVHCDIKVDNALVTTRNKRTEMCEFDHESVIKLCDFGLSNQIPCGAATLPLFHFPGRHPFGTLEYCAPELLREDTMGFSSAIDIWSAGCLMGELLIGKPLFQSGHKDAQLGRIHQLVGSGTHAQEKSSSCTCSKCKERQVKKRLRYRFPTSKLSTPGFNLLWQMLQPNPLNRITAEQALRHPWFTKQ